MYVGPLGSIWDFMFSLRKIERPGDPVAGDRGISEISETTEMSFF